MTYTANSLLATLKDAENNLTTYEYDGHDRLRRTYFPVPTKGANASSTTDYEQLLYDLNSNVTSFRNRAGQTIAVTYDTLNRATAKNLPGTEPDVSYAYDNLGRLTSASQTGNALSFTYDALSRNLTQAGPNGTTTYAYDSAGRRTSMTWPSGGTSLTVTYTYLTTNDLTAIKQGTTSLAAYAYNDLGSRTSLTFANGVVQAFGFDPVSRLASLGNALAGTANDLSKTFAYNPASQITQETKSNNAYAFPKTNVAETGTANGLNQLTSYAGKSLTHDTKGNVTAFGTDTFAYSSENLLTSATVGGTGTTLAYDPLMRLYQTVSGVTTSRFAYDGLDAIAEYNSGGTLQRRFVFDPTGITGQPIVLYEGTGTGSTVRRYLSSDERGSIVSVSDSNGAVLAINAYDEYGIPDFGALANQRFGYTGQAWLPSAGIYYYKARMYAPQIGGRFMQPDPIGYWDSPNLYAYVLNDPVNWVDPLGLCQYPGTGSVTGSGIDVWVTCPRWNFGGGASGSVSSGGAPGEAGTPSGRSPKELREGDGDGKDPPCTPRSDAVRAARDVLEAVATGSDVITVGLVAGVITAPAAVAVRAVGWVAEGTLLAVNTYDGVVNGSWTSLQIQGAGILGRLAPGGRTLQQGLIAARGPTGRLRNARGQFRSSHLKNPGIKEGGDLATQKYAEALAGAAICPR